FEDVNGRELIDGALDECIAEEQIDNDGEDYNDSQSHARMGDEQARENVEVFHEVPHASNAASLENQRGREASDRISLRPETPPEMMYFMATVPGILSARTLSRGTM